MYRRLRHCAAFLSLVFAGQLASAEIESAFTNLAVGSTSVDTRIAGVPIDDDSTAFRLLVGYQYTDFPALEIGYIDFDKYSSPAGDLNLSGITFGTVGHLPLNQTYNLRGRIGLMRWDADFDTGVAPYFSAGVMVHLTRDIKLTLDYEAYGIDDYEITGLMVGIQIYESKEL